MATAGQVLVGAAAGCLAFVLAHRLLSGRFWLWLLPDLVPPVLYLAGPVVLLAATPLAWAGGGRWYAVLATGALAAGAGHSGLNWAALNWAALNWAALNRAALNRAALSRCREPVPLDAVRVVAWNTEYWHQGQPPERFYQFLRTRRADVYVLQEYIYGPHRNLLPVHDLGRLRAEFPDHHVAVEGELVTLSRFPIVATPKVGPARALGPDAPWRAVYDLAKVLRTDLRVGPATFSVYNVHIPAQYVRADNPFAPGFYAELRDRNARRKAQLQGLHADIDANRNALLVTGDLNSTGAMRDIRGLSRRLASANRATRRLYPSSWPARGPALWQLDWAFTSGIRVHRYRFLDPQGFSDHRLQELLVSVPDH